MPNKLFVNKRLANTRSLNKAQRLSPRRLFTGPFQVLEEQPRTSLNCLINREASDSRKHSQELQLHTDLGLLIRQWTKADFALQRNAGEMAQEVYPPVGLETNQHLVHRSARTVDFDVQAALFFPRSALHPANGAQIRAPRPSIGLGVNREDRCQRTSYRDPNLKQTHRVALANERISGPLETDAVSVGEGRAAGKQNRSTGALEITTSLKQLRNPCVVRRRIPWWRVR
jgi:hypothetical protein